MLDIVSSSPPELGLKILSNLTPPDLNTASLVSSRWHCLANDDKLWKEILIVYSQWWDKIYSKSNPEQFFLNQVHPLLNFSNKNCQSNNNSRLNIKQIFQYCQEWNKIDSTKTVVADNSYFLTIVRHFSRDRRIIITGPGLESQNDSHQLIQRIMHDRQVNDAVVDSCRPRFNVIGLTPGEQQGFGGGVRIRLGDETSLNSDMFDMVALYSNVESVRNERQPFCSTTHADNRLKNEFGKLQPQVAWLCKQSQGIVYVLDGDQLNSPAHHLQTNIIINQFLSFVSECNNIPVLILICSSNYKPKGGDLQPNIKLLDIAQSMYLRCLPQKWLLQKANPITLEGVRQGFKWVIKHS